MICGETDYNDTYRDEAEMNRSSFFQDEGPVFVIAGKMNRTRITPGIKSPKSIVEKCALRYNEPNTQRNEFLL